MDFALIGEKIGMLFQTLQNNLIILYTQLYAFTEAATGGVL